MPTQQMENLNIHRRHGLQRDLEGQWSFTEDELCHRPSEGFHRVFNECALRYLTNVDEAFRAAKAVCEFEFVSTLLGVKGMHNMSWDSFETTRRVIPAMVKLHGRIKDFETQRHLGLWTYGHIVEASEPYERLANLIAVARGERFDICRFPAHKNGRPQSPGEKIKQIEQAATSQGIPQVAVPLKEIWDRELRNSVFHADYGLSGDSVILPSVRRVFTHEQIMTLVNGALAYHFAFTKLVEIYRETYERPKVIRVHRDFGIFIDEKATLVVREGTGVIGLKAAWTPEQIKRGHIAWFFGIVSRDEGKQLSANPKLNFFHADGSGEELVPQSD